VTKSFVAAVVLQLADEGRLALGDTVARWLPNTISNGDAITIRHLLNHTSGIFSYDKDESVFAPYLQGDLTRPYDQAAGVRLAAARGPLFAPGTKLDYSNTNYVLLGMIVEAATGNTIGTELHARIIGPLGLRRTSYPGSSRIAGAHTHGYMPGAKPSDITLLSPSLLGASGAIVSSAGDVATFYRALLTGRLLSSAGLAAMQRIDPVATGGIADAGIRGGGWGLGLLREQFPCAVAWGHDSETPGYMAAAWSSPSGSRQVVVVVNMAYDHAAPVSRAMRKVLTQAYCMR
jgi:D-alanyl-D-alanine carboxypeptidase